MATWNIIDNSTIRVVARVAPFLPYKEHVHLILISRLEDNTVDEMNDTRLERTPMFSVSQDRLTLELPISQEVLKRAYPSKNLWIYLVLLPTPLDEHQIGRLSDIDRLHGKILASNATVVGVSATLEPVPDKGVPPAPKAIPFISPGIRIDNDSWALFVRDFGGLPVYNLRAIIIDTELQGLANTDSTIPIGRIFKDVQVPEIDPIKTTIGPEMIKMTPLTLDHTHYNITLASRGGVFRESLSIMRIDGKFPYALVVTKENPKQTIIKCRDAQFPPSEQWMESSLPECFPLFH